MSTRERVMNQEQLMKQKIKYLEDRIEVMAKSIGSINKILGRFQMTEGKESKDPFIKVMEQGESDYTIISYSVGCMQ